ncbi:tyrosine-protein phosphatase [Aerosakkonemataceae cyanobacterium BLCC-F50]|uniref:Tyrosine-protein phosphatase n=1 Tax=Floridaenema flaviceps BLCC-F50 TaxID=3153642 RepID=A0ABV4XXN4_9CYAN
MKNFSNLQRHLPLEGSYNIRDIGGYLTAEGYQTRWKTILRSDSLHRLTPASQQALIDYGIKTIIDLRYASEVKNRPSIFAKSEQIKYLNIPLFGNELLEQLKPLKTQAENYYIWLDSCQAQFRKILETIIESLPSPILIHCTGGKDRTGLTIALLLSVANVPVNTIVEDFVLSGDYLAPMFAPLLPKARELGNAYMFECRAETLLDTFKYLDEKYGGVIGYLHTIGLTAAQLSLLRDLLVEERLN